MDNKPLNLDKLKVQSFVTSLDSQNNQTIKGGKAPQTDTCAAGDCVATDYCRSGNEPGCAHDTGDNMCYPGSPPVDESYQCANPTDAGCYKVTDDDLGC